MFEKYCEITRFIKSLYVDEKPVPLHAPKFFGNEKKYLKQCIDSTFVSYVGEFVNRFEEHILRFTGASYAVAMVNGTSALQIALQVAGVQPGDEVITQVLTFVATANAIKHAGGEVAFVDVDRETLGMSPEKLEEYLKENAIFRSGFSFNKQSGKKISACIPMHTFGHCAHIEDIIEICGKYNIRVIEDSAESLGSYYKGKHSGTFGVAGILSFNGNKPVTTGGGGMIITSDEGIAQKARHLTTTAKQKHPWSFFHDEIGYNLRMPNLNAAVGCAQMEQIDFILGNKRDLAEKYKAFFDSLNMPFVSEPADCTSNYWLNAIILNNFNEREDFLKYTNDNGIQTRPVWTLMNKLPMYKHCQTGNLSNAEWLEDRIVNIPSGVRI